MTKIGILGGTGLYNLPEFSTLREHSIETPFGPPSDLIAEASFADCTLYFLPRHGRHHHLLPGEINYRANIYALKSLGVTWCISVSAVGSLCEEMAPGHLVIPSQTIDRTTTRARTFFGDGITAHISFADPFCPTLARILSEEGEAHGRTVHRGATYVCIDGPAFSSRAEAAMHQQMGARIIGMTNLPEARLAREAEIAYATMAFVTDYDCWRKGEKDVEAHDVREILKANTKHAQQILLRVVARLNNETPSALASNALAAAIFSDLKLAPTSSLELLGPIIRRYLPTSE